MAENDDLIYKANLNIEDILSGLRKVDKSTEDTAKRIDAHFKKAGKSISGLFIDSNGRIREANGRFSSMGNAAARGFSQAEGGSKNLGLQMGIVSGVTSSLVTAFINLGQRAVSVLIEIGQQSIQTALEIDTLKVKLLGIFDGSQEAADEAFNFIQEKSKETGVNLSELAGAFIPKSESLAQFEKIAKIASVLATQDPLGMDAARIALQEALSGDFVSLRKRFEFVTKSDIQEIKSLQEELGETEGLIAGLEKVLDRQGLDFDDLLKTAQSAFNRLGIASEQLGGRIGVPIVESLQQAAEKILGFLNENEDDLIVFADTIGRAIADVIDFITGIDFSQLDTQTLIEIADYIFRIVGAAEIAGTQILTFVEQFSQLPGVSHLIQGLTYELQNLDDALLTLSQILALANASIGAFTASGVKAQVAMLLLSSAVKASHNDFVGAFEDFQKAQEVMASSVSAQDAFRESILASNQQFEEYRASLEGNTLAQDDLRDSLNETANAGTAAADAIQAAAAAERQAAEDADKLAEAQAKVNRALAEAEKDFKRKLEDIDIAAERKLLDISIEFAQKREDAAKDNLEKLADLRKKNAQDIQDAATDLSRDEEDIARKFAEERIDLEKEQRQKRVDVERDYRLKLQDIQRQFLLDADEAEQKRDAVAFLRAIKERDKQVQEAQITRQRDIDELRVNGEQRKEELRTQQARELEEARIANERKLEDLRLNLERQIEAQNTAYAQQLEDLAIGEQRKNEEAAQARERDIEDAKRAYERKLADLREALAEELALIEEFAAAASAALDEANSAGGVSPSSGHGPLQVQGNENVATTRQGSINTQRQRATYSSSRQGGINSNRQLGRAFGGLVNRGQTIPVGEDGPELFTPDANGRIIPSNQLLLPSFTPKSAINNITNSQQSNVNLGVLDPDSVGVLNEARMRNIVLSILAGL